jgi:hypothetical protein
VEFYEVGQICRNFQMSGNAVIRPSEIENSYFNEYRRMDFQSAGTFFFSSSNQLGTTLIFGNILLIRHLLI